MTVLDETTSRRRVVLWWWKTALQREVPNSQNVVAEKKKVKDETFQRMQQFPRQMGKTMEIGKMSVLKVCRKSFCLEILRHCL